MRVVVTNPRNDIERFTRGGCFILACVIHDLTGWPICAFWNDLAYEPDHHVFNLMPDGRYLDIKGAYTKQEMIDEWGGFAKHGIVEDIDPLDLWNWSCPFDHEETYERAMEIAPELIKANGG
jgi:hypothetical protein